jgi:putative tryptophan/tyrosine transport system substrate-binding protein
MVIRRRIVVALGAGLLAAPFAALAQQPARVPRIGVLWHASSAQEEGAFYTSLLEGFKELGYADGRNILLEHRFPNETPERFKSMAAELVSLKVDVLVGVGSVTSLFVKNATRTIPVVFVYATDPVRDKLVESLARPGGNVTGLTNLQVGLIGKRLEFLRQIMPGVARIGYLVQPSPVARQSVEEAQFAAASMGLQVRAFEVRSAEDIPPAFDAMRKAGMQAVLTGAGMIYQHRGLVGKTALAHRRPISGQNREITEAGAIISYGPDQRAMIRRAAVYVDKILNGANPALMPVEQPATFELIINRSTATALGIKIPNGLMMQATQIID